MGATRWGVQHPRQTTLTTTSPAGLSATTGITLGGHPVAADGSFRAPAFTPIDMTGIGATVTLRTGSAAIIRFDAAGTPTPRRPACARAWPTRTRRVRGGPDARRRGQASGRQRAWERQCHRQTRP